MGDDARGTLKGRLATSIHEVGPAAWDACAGTANPFLAHAFLAALEDSKSVGPRTGWAPRHLVIEDEGDRVAAVVPLYVKSHSQGEYVFDHAWADALERAGGRYYPKLQAAVPFTPVPGRRLLVAPDGDVEALRRAVIGTLVEVARGADVSSLHITFPEEDEWQAMERAGLIARLGLQYHWDNPGYGTFDDFLGTLKSAKRKAIRRERREVAESGVAMRALTGEAILPRHWDAFFAFYMDTGGRKWGRPYLTREFFRRLAAAMPERVLLVMAERDGQPVAGALNMVGEHTLYGRYWGCVEDHRFLHFEACYYQAIDYAIAHGLKRVEAGAQGEHKFARGYLAKPTYSAHWIGHEGLRRAVEDVVRRERAMVEREIAALNAEHSPYRNEGEG
jgi:predicted N-acyltransferase